MERDLRRIVAKRRVGFAVHTVEFLLRGYRKYGDHVRGLAVRPQYLGGTRKRGRAGDNMQQACEKRRARAIRRGAEGKNLML